MKKIKFLNIIRDDKFFDPAINGLESDNCLENHSVLIVNSPDYQFVHINQKEKVELLWNERMIKDYLQSREYDVVFFHTLAPRYFKLIDLIPQDRIIVWWSWGFDIYGGFDGMNPIIKIDKYKQETAKLSPELGHSIKEKLRDIKYYLQKRSKEKLFDKVLPRIDFFNPVIPLEFRLMQNMEGFHAKEFYTMNAFPFKMKGMPLCEKTGSILFGNSATYTNNHLDVWSRIKHYVPKDRTVIIPLSYGNKRYARLVEDRIESTSASIRFLNTMLPKEEYFKLIGSCSYAVFGMIRQQAMGNVYQCLQDGIKVFLYKDSIVYKDLSENGFVVSAIEDIDENSFNTPLSKEELEQQSRALEERHKYVERVRKEAFEEITKRI